MRNIMGFFSTEGGLYKFMTTLWNVFKINMLWILCSIPIVTFGASTIAAFDVMMKMSDDEEGYVARQFIKSFKSNIKNGIPLGLLFIVCLYIVWLDFSLFNQLEDNPIVLLIAGIIAVFIFVLSFIYAFALEARYENTLFRTLKNSVDISMKYFGRTFLLVLVILIELVAIFWNSVTMFVGFLIGPACIIFTISSFARYFFRALEKEPGAVTNPEQKGR